MAPKFNILSLSGGGYLGLYTVSVLAKLETELGRPIASCFDLIAGTSIGGIIALGLAAEVPCRDIKEAFEQNGTRIFSPRPAPTSPLDKIVDTLRFAYRAKYRSENLRATVAQLVGDGLRIGDLKHPVIVPAVNLTKGKPQVFKTPHHPDFVTDLQRLVIDVAIATSAAPTFFPLAEHGDELFADGGLYANAPDLLALHEAERYFGVKAEDISLLSIGTTTSHYAFAHADGTDLGAWNWMKGQRLFNVMIAAQQQSVGFMMRHRLGERYLRLDAETSVEQQRHLGLDVATKDAQSTIRGLASGTVQQHRGSAPMTSLLSHHAPPPQFFLGVA